MTPNDTVSTANAQSSASSNGLTTLSEIEIAIPQVRRPPKVARAALAVGDLVDDESTTLTLHTIEAIRAFLGRQARVSANIKHIAGGKRFASVLKTIWRLSAKDNPYADWLLIQIQERIDAIKRSIEAQTEEKLQLIDLARARGISFSVLRSSAPKTLVLNFSSPYGFAMAELIRLFDYYVRTLKTLMLKDTISDEAGQTAIRDMARELRTLFMEPMRWEKALLRPELIGLRRADFYGATPDAGRRVSTAKAELGTVPIEILEGRRTPRHSLRLAGEHERA